jgi:outer membrane receptor protein involved in Fe transport
VDERIANQAFIDVNQVLNARSLNSIKGGSAYVRFLLQPIAGWGTSGNRRPPGTSSLFRDVFGGEEIAGGVPVLAFSGYSFGNTNNPQSSGEKVYSLRDDFATSFDLGGRHDIKAGGEYIRYTMDTAWCNNCNGTLGFNVAPPANIESLIPNAMDASTWNLRALSPLVRDYRIAIGDFAWAIKRNLFAGWVQDDWAVSNRLTLNMGVRYDNDLGGHGEAIVFEPWLTGRRPHDLNNLAPRTGFAYQIDDRMVLRGGYGLFFTQLEADAAHQSQLQIEHVSLTGGPISR